MYCTFYWTADRTPRHFILAEIIATWQQSIFRRMCQGSWIALELTNGPLINTSYISSLVLTFRIKDEHSGAANSQIVLIPNKEEVVLLFWWNVVVPFACAGMLNITWRALENTAPLTMRTVGQHLCGGLYCRYKRHPNITARGLRCRCNYQKLRKPNWQIVTSKVTAVPSTNTLVAALHHFACACQSGF